MGPIDPNFLAGRLALVTGAAGGIGSATARALALSGALMTVLMSSVVLLALGLTRGRGAAH
jgi:NAD(P)-dependent dehydrogenase (short-subunit alcohol dehydrogenase family)